MNIETRSAQVYRLAAAGLSIAFAVIVAFAMYGVWRGLSTTVRTLEYAQSRPAELDATVEISIIRARGAVQRAFRMMHVGWLVALLLALGFFLFESFSRVVRVLPLLVVALCYGWFIFLSPL